MHVKSACGWNGLLGKGKGRGRRRTENGIFVPILDVGAGLKAAGGGGRVGSAVRNGNADLSRTHLVLVLGCGCALVLVVDQMNALDHARIRGPFPHAELQIGHLCVAGDGPGRSIALRSIDGPGNRGIVSFDDVNVSAYSDAICVCTRETW